MRRIISSVLLLSLLLSCAQKVENTRGIGVYPGYPEDYVGPTIVEADDTYRNLALGRVARHSSSYDYNLTAHLASDGIITDQKPVLLEVETSDGPVSKLMRDALFDGNDKRPLSVNATKGAFVRVKFFNTSIDCDKVTLEYENGTVDVRNIYGKEFFVNLPYKEDAIWHLKLMRFFKNNEEISVLPSEQFVSCWMPQTNGQEWMYVDLGAKSKFDKIILSWIGAIPTGDIEVSDDAKQWKQLCQIPNASEIALKGEGRYVRLMIEKSNGEAPCALSEIEILGTGGVKAIAATQPCVQDDVLMLQAGKWKLQRQSEVASSGEELSLSGYDDHKWTIATVPGTVATSYFNAGAIPDIRYDDDQFQISESFFLSNFWYRDEFTVPESFKGKTVLLNLKGVNWKADIYLNGSYLGNLAGAYRRTQFDVSDLLVWDKPNSIAILIHRNNHPGAVKEQTRQSTDLNGGILGADNPTFHASIGWDWIPTVRGRNIGIWNDIFLSAHALNVSIKNSFIETDLPLPSVEYADINTSLVLKNHNAEAVCGEVKVKIGEDVLATEYVELASNETKNIVLKSIRMDNPKLWWPAGYGEQYLYDAEISFESEGVVSDKEQMKLGVREMSYDDADGSLDIYINGRRLIGNGGNWGFPEINLNYSAREYDIAVAYHADMGFTLIRNWVGQTGNEEFYEACDRHGVMVWQDFWLANPWDGPSPYYEDLFVDNAKDYVLRIRNHPCIALYCGRNEGMPPATINKALIDIVSKYHPSNHYIPHSADITVSGFGPYRALSPDDYFALEPGRSTLHSERGMPNVMTYESMSRMLDEENQWPQNSVWGIHDYTLESAQRCSTFNDLIHKAFGEPKDLKQFTKWAQWVNYDGYRAMYESRSWNRKGLLIWMSHSCWPSMVWQTYDYYFEPTAAYFGAKKASAAIRIQYNPVIDKVEVVNNNALDQNGLVAKAALVNMYGDVVFEDSKQLDAPEDTTISIFSLPFNLPALTDVYFVKLTLYKEGKEIASNFYTRAKEYYNFKKLLDLPSPDMNVKFSYRLVDGKYECVANIKNNGKTPALMIRLNVVRKSSGEQILPVFYEDNYISLLPGEKRSIRIHFKAEDTGGEKPDLKYEVSL